MGPSEVTLLVIRVLDRQHVPYFLAGSVASSILGLPRSSIDSDLVVDLRREKVAGLVSELKEQFYVDADMIRLAIERRSMFNVIHFETSFKVDFYLLGKRLFDQEEFKRRQIHDDLPGWEGKIYLATPEDIVLSKLEWYRKGGEVSERQWSDLLGVLRVQGTRLDWSYIDSWSRKLRVSRLLKRARKEALAVEDRALPARTPKPC